MWRCCINVMMILAVPLVMSLPTHQVKDDSKDKSSILFESSGVKGVKLIEGDIMVSNRNTFNAIVNKLSKWPNGWVPSVIQKGHSCYSQIVTEMHTMLKNSCIHFYTRRPWEADYLYFAEYKGCFSWIGRTGGKQTISIGKNCCNSSTIQHEMMHALGFYHEHNRPDRDNYVKINWNNIQSEHYKEFMKKRSSDVTTFNTSFDFKSVMLYGSNSFGHDTIVRKDNGGTITTSSQMSATDWLRLKKHYNCK